MFCTLGFGFVVDKSSELGCYDYLGPLLRLAEILQIDQTGIRSLKTNNVGLQKEHMLLFKFQIPGNSSLNF